MKIVYTMPFFDPATQFGGPVTQMRELCRGLSQRGHEVRVVTTDMGIGPQLPRDTWFAKDGYQVWYARTRWYHRIAPYYTPTIRSALREVLPKADLLHLQLGMNLTNNVARKEAVKLKLPYAYTPRGVLCPVRLQARAFMKAVFLRLYERRTIREAVALQALTLKEADDLRLQGATDERIKIIPNGIDPGDPEQWPEGGLFRKQFQIAEDALLVLFLGRLQKIKGIDLLISTIARNCERHPRLVLALAGPEEDCGPQARKQIADLGLENIVRFTGEVKGDMKLSALRAADIFALTSYSEGLSNAVLEACAAGLPMLLTDRCNTPEVGLSGAGRVEPPEVERLAEALNQMLSDEGMRRTMSTNARRLALERFSTAHVLDEYEKMYEEMLSAGKGSS